MASSDVTKGIYAPPKLVRKTSFVPFYTHKQTHTQLVSIFWERCKQRAKLKAETEFK